MANTGRFIDRSPLIRAAGKSTGVPKQTVSSCLKQYADNAIHTFDHEAQIWTEPEYMFARPRELHAIKSPFAGTNWQRFQELMENNEEAWEDEEGRQYHRKAHNDYNPSEQLDKGYYRPDRYYGASLGMDSQELEQKQARYENE